MKPCKTRGAIRPVRDVSEPSPGRPFMLERERRPPKGLPAFPPDIYTVGTVCTWEG